MNGLSLILSVGSIAVLAAGSAAPVPAQQPTKQPAGQPGQWGQWGGPNRDFAAPPAPLADAWPQGGPRRIWSKTFNALAASAKPRAGGVAPAVVEREKDGSAGHGGIAVRGDLLCTSYRAGGSEVLCGLRVADGALRWQHPFPLPRVRFDYGPGPFATPLMTSDSAFFQLGSGVLCAVRITTGEILWQRNLRLEFPGSLPGRGFAASPLLVDGRLIVIPNAPRATVVALDPRSGKTLWRRGGFAADYTSPVVVTIDSRDWILVHLEKRVAAVRVADGELAWSVPSRSERTRHVTSPILCGPGRVFVNTTYGSIAYDFRVDQDGAGLRGKKRWTSRFGRMQVGNGVFVPDHEMVVAAGSASSPAFLVALDANTGARLWVDRGVDMGHLIRCGGDLLAVTHSGEVLLTRPTRAGIEILARSQVLASNTWGAPALVGTRLYLRDEHRILGLDLPVEESGPPGKAPEARKPRRFPRVP